MRWRCWRCARFSGLSLLTYDPADSLDALVYPPPRTHAQCLRPLWGVRGRPGLSGLGIAAWYLVVSLAVVDVWLLARRPISEPILAYAWAGRCRFVGLGNAVALVADGWSPGPVIGPGGYLGAAGRGLLEMHFASAGSLVLTISVLVGGSAAVHRILLPTMILPSFWPCRVAALGRVRLRTAQLDRPRRKRRARSRTDLDGDTDTAERDGAVDSHSAARPRRYSRKVRCRT